MAYLDTFDGLENFEATDVIEKCSLDYKGQQFQELNGAPISGKHFSRRNKVLFCHDMKGGYLDDALRERNENIYAYRFYYWNLIDIFVYFSHHFITIPPIGWIYQSHRNAVQCLGTFIVEGDKNKNLSWLLAPGNIEIAAQKLTAIKNAYNFEGWLINIECCVEYQMKEETVEKLLWFLARLVQLGNEVHWYDAITTDGTLQWQNGLTELNKPFYDVCGNIFLNYCWNEATLSESIQVSKGDLHQVFVGVDCFGRGCPGGGKLRCDVALKMIEKVFKDNESRDISKFSIALFAPGWCYESVSHPQNEKEVDDLAWLFFKLMEKHLQPWLDGRTVYRQLPELIIDRSNSFITNFDIGQGVSNWSDGQEISKGNYNWLMDQNLTPTGTLTDLYSSRVKILPYRKSGYSGHGCMVMVAESSEAIPDLSLGPITVELFRLECVISGCQNGHISFVLVLGRDFEPDTVNILGTMSIVLYISDAESDMKAIRFTLDDIRVHHFTSESSKIEWNKFEIRSLSTELHSAASSSLTIRKIDIEIVDGDALEYMTKKNVYFGQLAIVYKEQL